ncbi:MAG: outer membrane beta-barrel protein [Burkholderiales bacterium]|nr:outer membrane beta-barrel protein [Burkholderiales bacterium]
MFALAGMAALSSASLAQQPRPDAPLGPVAAPAPYSPSASAAAQEGAAQAGGLSLKLMGLLVTARPSIKVETRYDDNIYLSPNNRTADQILVLTPALSLETAKGSNKFSLRLSTTIGQYQNNRADNYTNTTLNGTADFDLGTRLRARLAGDIIDGVDPRGSTNNPISNAPDHYRQTSGRGVFSYGSQGARGRLDFELGQVRREYLNNRATTAASDRVVNDLGATFNWRIGPKTTLLIQGKHSIVDYTLPASTLGSIENTLLGGAIWEVTAKTNAEFRIGVVKKDFDDAVRAGSSSISWTGKVGWSPLTYSHVDLSLSRVPAETSGGVGNFIDKTNTGVRWTHEWNGRFTTEGSASYATDDYQGAARTDNTQTYGAKATYKMRRWLNLGADYSHSMRSSSDGNFDYQHNVFMFFIDTTL